MSTASARFAALLFRPTTQLAFVAGGFLVGVQATLATGRPLLLAPGREESDGASTPTPRRVPPARSPRAAASAELANLTHGPATLFARGS